MILDTFSYLTPDHPLFQAAGPSSNADEATPPTTAYLVAPDPQSWQAEAEGAADHFLATMQGLTGIAGGLLPVVGLSDEAFTRVLAAPLVRGLVLSALFEPSASLTDARTRARVMQARELPVVIDAGFEGFSRPDHLEAFLQWFYMVGQGEGDSPRPCILTHGGQLCISGAHLSAAGELFRHFPHTLLETSGIYRQDFLEEMLQALGAERLLFGSGHPMMHERLELERVCILPVGQGALNAITGETARRLFGLPVGGGSRTSRS